MTTKSIPDPDDTTATGNDVGSIIDNILSLDALLSADVRRAEDVHRLYRRPDLLATITELTEKLEAITDESGRPLASAGGDDSLADGGNPAHTLALQIEQARREYMAASGVVKLRQLGSADWEAFKVTWKAELDKVEGPGLSFFDALIAATVSEPRLTVENVGKMRDLYGAPQLNALSTRCWSLNNESGVSVPKSLRSSAVLRRRELETS